MHVFSLGKNVASKDLHSSGASASNLSRKSKCCWHWFLHSCVKVNEFLEEIVADKKMKTCTLLIFQVHMIAGRTEIIQCKEWQIVEPIIC